MRNENYNFKASFETVEIGLPLLDGFYPVQKYQKQYSFDLIAHKV